MGKTDPGPDPIQLFASTQDTVFLCIIIWAFTAKKGGEDPTVVARNQNAKGWKFMFQIEMSPEKELLQ